MITEYNYMTNMILTEILAHGKTASTLHWHLSYNDLLFQVRQLHLRQLPAISYKS